VTGAGANFDDRESLSEEGSQALQEICRLIPRLIQDFLTSCDARAAEW
jgi:hypothetical protein